MSGRLSDVRAEFERTMMTMDAGHNRDVVLGQYMNVLERDHGVPVTHDWRRVESDTPAKELYLEIAASRKMA